LNLAIISTALALAWMTTGTRDHTPKTGTRMAAVSMGIIISA
jgi:hypothetical protein